MDFLIHADSGLNEIGVVDAFTEFDSQIRNNSELADNTYQLTMPLGAWENDKILKGDYIYVDGTEFGGIVCYVQKDSEAKTVTIKGQNWRGMLTSILVCPNSSTGYRTYSGVEANDFLGELVGDSLGGIFVASEEDTGKLISVSIRYRTALEAMTDTLERAGYVLSCIYSAETKTVTMSARIPNDYSDYYDISFDLGIGLKIADGRIDTYNHIIGLGRGELADRQVVEYWLNGSEVVTSQPSSLKDGDIRTYKYDYQNVESLDELETASKKKLLEFADTVSCDVDLSLISGLTLELGDIIEINDRDFDISEKRTVYQKVMKITPSGGTKYETEVE